MRINFQSGLQQGQPRTRIASGHRSELGGPYFLVATVWPFLGHLGFPCHQSLQLSSHVVDRFVACFCLILFLSAASHDPRRLGRPVSAVSRAAIVRGPRGTRGRCSCRMAQVFQAGLGESDRNNLLWQNKAWIIESFEWPGQDDEVDHRAFSRPVLARNAVSAPCQRDPGAPSQRKALGPGPKATHLGDGSEF